MRLGLPVVGIATVWMAACVGGASPRDVTARTAVAGDSALVDAFQTAAAESGVPVEVLAATAYDATRFRAVSTDGSHGPARTGVFALTAADRAKGAALAGTHPSGDRDLDDARIAAALLRATGATTVEQYAAARPDLVRELRRGVDARDDGGARVIIAAHPRLATPGGLGVIQQGLVGYDTAEWVPASTQNYSTANRTTADVDHIVIHTTEGQYNGTLSWFQDPDASVSAHYVVRSRDGHIAQMVDEKNIAWHDKCFNTTTVGIEHEAFSDHPDVWFTEEMYSESAKLTANIADRYGIPKEHGSILGHGEAPDCSDHEDPGPYWDWDHYMDLVKTGGAPTFDAGDVTVDGPTQLVAGDVATVTVTMVNRGNTTWNIDETRLGTAEPQDRASALFVDGSWIAPNRPAGVSAAVAPGETGTFAFSIVAPDVETETAFDEAFQLVEEDMTWFGPPVQFGVTVSPAAKVEPPADDGGCNASGAGSGGGACAMVALGALLVRRRRPRV